MNVEDLLRDTVTPRAGSDPAVEERVRREAMAALSRMRRRHRVRRAVSVGAAAAGVAAIAAFFVFAMPRGGDAPAPGSEPPLPVSLLQRPERAVDRLPGDPARYGVGAALGTVRFAVAGDRLRFYAVRPADRDEICIVATTNPGGRPRGAACNTIDTLRRVGALAFLYPDATGRQDVGIIVPDGIDRIVLNGATLTVSGNAAAGTMPLSASPTVTLVGSGAPDITPDAGPDWPRSEVGGAPAVTVPLSRGGQLTNAPTPLDDLRLIAPASAPAGTVVAIRVAAPSGLVDGNVSFGVHATLDRRDGAAWVPSHHLTVTPSADAPAPAVPANTPNYAWVDIGLGGSAPHRVWLPSVAPGTYRIRMTVNGSSEAGTPGFRDLTAEIAITPDPVTPPASADGLIDRTTAEVVAMDSDGARVWRAPAPPEASPPGTAGELTCWLFLGGTDCTGAADLARTGGFAMTYADADGTWRTAVVAAPGATAIRIAGRQRLMVNGVAFASGLSTGRPDVEVVFRGGAVKRLR